jgi:hypothetical protein
MALIAAASINVDWALFVTIALICAGVIAAALLIGAIIYAIIRMLLRAFFRNLEEPDWRNAPRVRTRIHQTPIDKDIAEFLHREYPNRKPAQFI